MADIIINRLRHYELHTYYGKQQTVGRIDENIFSKTVKKSKHLFRKTNSWGIDYSILVDSIIPNCDIIKIYEEEEGICYTCPVNYYGSMVDFVNFGEVIGKKFQVSGKAMIKQFDKKKHGLQVFLPLHYFSTNKYK